MNLELVKLNWRLFRLYLQGREIETSDFKRSYNLLAYSYDDEWYAYLDAVTSDIFKNLEGLQPEIILDLGCGTGGSTTKLKNIFSESYFVALDFSKQMLDLARKKLGSDKTLFCRDYIETSTQKFSDNQFDLIVCAWSLGYARQKNVYKNLKRILKPGGHLLILSNKEDTLKAVRAAMKYTMFKHYKRVKKVPVHKFPANIESLTAKFGNGFEVVKSGEGHFSIDISHKSSVVEWLLSTGILAGFEYILNLRRSEPCKKTFEAFIKSNYKDVTHNYMWLMLKKK